MKNNVQIIVRMPDSLKKKFKKKAKIGISETVRSLMIDYLEGKKKAAISMK